MLLLLGIPPKLILDICKVWKHLRWQRLTFTPMRQVDPSFVKRADFRAAVPGEFIDYVFSDASGAAKTILADGFGLDAFLGFAGQEEEVRDYDSDDDDLNQMKGVPEDRIGQPRNVPGIFFCTCVELAESKQCVVGIILPKWPCHFGSSLGTCTWHGDPILGPRCQARTTWAVGEAHVPLWPRGGLPWVLPLHRCWVARPDRLGTPPSEGRCG